MIHELRLFFIALQFLTRLPAPRWVGFEPDWLNQSARHFPAVGLLVGAVAALVLVLGELLFPPAVAVGLSMAATLLLTGAFHEDGWADTCDALGGGASIGRERALVIMKDSRIGTYGAVGLVLMLGLKAGTLIALPLALAVPALLFAHTASRAAAVALIRWLPYAGDVEHAKAKPLAQRISRGGLVVALGWVVVLCLALGWAAQRWDDPALLPSILIGLVVVAGTAAWCARWFRQRLGGYTGDTLGATQQITELLALLVWLGVAEA
ncbi:MAG: adenosylcobinamide-GDP ribazoletransferase [Burkholderiales bacterium]|nr:adenosylcobinamide-GDP ribazoletransferase [Burkholderiales bacterium]